LITLFRLPLYYAIDYLRFTPLSSRRVIQLRFIDAKRPFRQICHDAYFRRYSFSLLLLSPLFAADTRFSSPATMLNVIISALPAAAADTCCVFATMMPLSMLPLYAFAIICHFC